MLYSNPSFGTKDLHSDLYESNPIKILLTMPFEMLDWLRLWRFFKIPNRNQNLVAFSYKHVMLWSTVLVVILIHVSMTTIDKIYFQSNNLFIWEYLQFLFPRVYSPILNPWNKKVEFNTWKRNEYLQVFGNSY
jgi:hypothetical protein